MRLWVTLAKSTKSRDAAAQSHSAEQMGGLGHSSRTRVGEESVYVRAAACLFLDDSVSNMKAARAMGWTNVLVGTHARDGGELIVCEHADHIIRTVHDFEALMPEHFRDGGVEDAVGGRRRAVEDAVPKAS